MFSPMKIHCSKGPPLYRKANTFEWCPSLQGRPNSKTGTLHRDFPSSFFSLKRTSRRDQGGSISFGRERD